MGFLSKLLQYNKIVIQCHNNPDSDALASGLAVYKYLKSMGKKSEIVYGGYNEVEKGNIKYMIRECNIPIRFVKEQSEIGIPEVLITVDCQYGQSNVTKFDAEHIMIIDHHIQMVEESEEYYINSKCQSCSTIMYELLLEEGYDVDADELLKIALYYGLYIDTSSFRDIYSSSDIHMKQKLKINSPVLTRMIYSTINVAELMIVCDALFHHYLDIENGFIIISVMSCDQSVLGIIGDMVIQVDICSLSFTYMTNDINYQFSIRSCGDDWNACELAKYISKDIGSGGGHANKAGGIISKQLFETTYPGVEIEDYINRALCSYIN